MKELFESIYSGNYSIDVNPGNILETPLDAESKPPMLFEEIYAQCNKSDETPAIN
jgi:hypothetical protein